MACIRERRNRLVIDYYDQHGKRRWETLPEGTTKTQAGNRLREIQEKIDKGGYLPPKAKKKELAFSRVSEKWLKAKSRGIRANTLESYQGHIENHLKPYYGNTPITNINLDSVERFISDCEKRAVTVATTKKILRTFGAVMDYACKKKYIDHNPVKYAEKPSRDIDLEEEDTVEVYTPEQIRLLLKGVGWVKKDIERDGVKQALWVQMEPTERLKYKTLIMLAVDTGMRQGELLGAKWEDVSWEMAQIQIKRSFNHGRFYQPKTKSSRRRIDLSPQMLNQLAEWQRQCPESSDNLIFPNGKGNPMNCNNLYNRVYLPAIEKAGVPRLTFHALRHTFASILIDQGENIKYIQSQLGHAKASTTLDIYGHLMKQENPEAAKKRGNLLFLESGSKMVAIEAPKESRNAESLANKGCAHSSVG
jgi:integrase